MALLCQYQPGREVEAPQLGHISVGVLANGTWQNDLLKRNYATVNNANDM